MSGRAYLVQKFPVEFVGPHTETIRGTERSSVVLPNTVNIFAYDGSDESAKLSTLLRSLITGDDSGNRSIVITIVRLNKTFGKGTEQLQIRVYGAYLNELLKSLDNAILKVSGKLTKYRDNSEAKWRVWDNNPGEFCTVDMVPRKIWQQDNIVFEDTLLTYIEDIFFRRSYGQDCCFNISLLLSGKVVQRSPMVELIAKANLSPPRKELLSFMESLLYKQFQTDMVILSDNGTQHPCHKIILAGSSTVFENVLSKKMNGSEKNPSINVNGMTENGVNAFLGYLYCLDVQEASDNFDIALELLEASEKFKIDRLAVAMGNIFSRNLLDVWNEPEKALKVFALVRNMSNCDELKTAAVKVLKMASDGEDFFASEVYSNFFVSNPSAAKDLCTVLIKL